MKSSLFIASIVLFMSMQSMALAQSIGDYLIQQDIGTYKLDKPEKHLPGEPPSGGPRTYDKIGASGTNHFPNHVDKNYVVMYLGGEANASPTVLITHHYDSSDSLKWLRHEIDSNFRDYYGIPSVSYTPRQISGQTILVNSVGGRNYRWLSGNKLITIYYRGSLKTIPEPIEVVQAYLAKHPSSIVTVNLAQLRSVENKTTWIKDEMDRRLWLCGKWFYHLQLGKVEQREVFEQNVKSMNVFLDYREKYYGVKAADEKNLLAGYLNTNNGTGIKAKLDEYKKWWAVNKEKAISL